MLSVRERGPQALHEPNNIDRLSRCDDNAIAEIDARVTKLEGGQHAELAAALRKARGDTGAGAEQTKPTAADTWPKPDLRIIEDDRVPAPKLDDDALPAGWAEWITTEAAARACPRDYVAAGLIGTASGIIGNARRVMATADWTEPAPLWFAEIGGPSTGKTPAQRPMIDVCRVIESDAEPAWREALAAYERDAEAAKARDKAWRDAVRAAAIDGTAPLDRPANTIEPDAPPRPRVAVMNTSTEELMNILAENPRGLLYVRDELAAWFGEFDRYGGKGADRAFYLECWNGGAYVCDRVKHDEPVRIEHCSLAIIGGMVPDRLREALADADDGLAARLTFVWPEPEPIAPLHNRGDEDATKRWTMLLKAARRLRALAMGADAHRTPAPRALPLDDDARKLFDEVRQDAMTRARSACGLAAGWHGKNPGRALRLALNYELLAWAVRSDDVDEPKCVSADAMARAGEYIDYANAMLDRVTGGLAIGQAEADAAAIARYVDSRAPAMRLKPLNERELYQAPGYAWARDADRRAAALRVLDHAGWIRRPAAARQGRPRGDWEVSPRLREEADRR